MNCHCGAVPMAEIERVLLDPRNRSASFWRECLADQLLLSQDIGGVEDTNAAELSRTPCPWSRELKLLDRGLMLRKLNSVDERNNCDSAAQCADCNKLARLGRAILLLLMI